MARPFSIASLSPDIGDHIRKVFPHDYNEVTQAIETFIQDQDYMVHERPRIVRCILYLAQSEKRPISQVLVSVRGDLRDAILWAEYEGLKSGETLRQVRDFTKPFGKNEIQ